MSIQKLPPEVISIVFNHIEGLCQLAKCRLTCKAWETIAERIMLGRKICLFTSYEVDSLVQLLKRHPENARLIKHLTIEPSEDLSLLELDTCYELLQLAMTPSMQVLHGSFNTDLFGAIIEFAQKSPVPFSLKEIPYPSDKRHDDAYYQAAYEFRHSLQHVYLFVQCTPNPIVFRFERFTHLTQLYLDGHSIEIEALNDCLHQCHWLTNLSIGLQLSFYGEYSPSLWDTMSEEATLQWIKDKHVQKESTSITIEYGNIHSRPDIIEYLVYKYPNMQKMVAIGKSDRRSIHNKSIRYVKALKHIPAFNLKSTLIRTEDVLTELAGRPYSLTYADAAKQFVESIESHSLN